MRRVAIALVTGALSIPTVAGCADDAAACDNEDVSGDPSVIVWTDTEGCDVITTEVHSTPGDAACGWELVDVIVIGEHVYHWDPVNLLAYVDQRVRNRTFRTVDIIADLTDTGWRRDGEELWRDTADASAVFLVRGDQTDRYLLDADGLIVCAD